MICKPENKSANSPLTNVIIIIGARENQKKDKKTERLTSNTYHMTAQSINRSTDELQDRLCV